MRLLLALVLLASPVSPVDRPHVVAPFGAPSDEFAAGHRGVDLVAVAGAPVRAPIGGVIAFAGRVAGRGVVTIADGDRVASLEPVDASVTVGSTVQRGTVVGTVGAGGHCALRCVHFGLRVQGRYVAPLAAHARLVP